MGEAIASRVGICDNDRSVLFLCGMLNGMGWRNWCCSGGELVKTFCLMIHAQFQQFFEILFTFVVSFIFIQADISHGEVSRHNVSIHWYDIRGVQIPRVVTLI